MCSRCKIDWRITKLLQSCIFFKTELTNLCQRLLHKAKRHSVMAKRHIHFALPLAGAKRLLG